MSGRSTSLRILLLIGLAFSAGPVRGEDRVTLRGPSGVGRVSHTGTVIDYNGRELVIQSRDRSNVHRLPVEDVIEISTNYLPAHAEGRKLLRAGDVAAAQKLLEAAYENESRDWVRREILSLLVQCALYRGDHLAAAERFLMITASDPQTPYFSLAPLVWNEAPPESALAARALTWLQSKNDVARLLGASVLLARPPFGDQSQATLRELASSGNLPLQRHAQLQLWRLRAHRSDISVNAVRHWERQLDDLPRAARAGAYLLLADAYEQTGDPSHALACALRTGLSGTPHRALAAQALRSAERLAERTGDRPTAQAVAAEIQSRFSDLTVTADAER
ncbi:MAG TPA: hypothetical protein VL132_03395 [Planctomycetaceae bacterium]|jgi:hypothetical protein|nr:hypothetical protein [Planctomycetaceae bacterium]